ncbi:hypothetical protein C0995_015446 [Termitomyces sp. Mi166|nr:hypothetical protein C0995_015446 [Termitomyces sp. Mi166\
MFSSIASFLPSLHLPNSNGSSVLSPTQNKFEPKFEPSDTPEEEEAYQDEPVEEETNAKKGKTKSVNETFIIVRPPPAKSNHPLNLQVQLVPPAARNSRQSVDDSDGGNSTTTSVSLTRTMSNRSDTSSYGSTASFSSTSSVSSTRRTIIPLYSLQAHNVLTNTIVDAGTDAKIAKLLKRGMELIDLAMLEPVEVWSDRRRSTQAPQPPPVIRTSRPVTPDPGAHTTTAESSVVSLTSSSNHHATTPSATPTPKSSTPTGLSAALPSSSKRNLFGKMFKKKDSSSATPPATPVPTRSSPSTSPLQATKTLTPDPSTTPMARSQGHSRQLSATLSPASLTDKLRHRSSSPNTRALGLGLLQVPTLEDPSYQNNSHGIENRSSTFIDENAPIPLTPNQNDEGKNEGRILRPPVLGIQPTLSYSYSPTAGGAPEPLPAGNFSKSARALMYVWFVKRWYKRRADDPNTGGLLGMVQHPRTSGRGSGFSVTGVPTHVAAGEGVEVRFEWKRNSAKARARKGRGRKGRKGDETEAEKGKAEKERPRDKDERLHRLSTISHQSVSTSEDGRDRSRTRDSVGERRRSIIRNRYDEEDEDSDPEDSETPWTCTLKIRRSGTGTTGPRSPRGSAVQGNGGEDELGVLPQAPHVLRLKVGTLSPTPHHPKVLGMLKVPFPLPDIEVERMGMVKRPTDPGETRQLSEWEGLTLRAEEIKDVVCSTAMWLTVREGFGGVGRVSRKGDGWRIRA